MPDPVAADRHTAGKKKILLPGDGSEVCALCGIHRQNAGFLKETCGAHHLKPGCFVQEVDSDA